jgi:hypothetical protein
VSPRRLGLAGNCTAGRAVPVGTLAAKLSTDADEALEGSPGLRGRARSCRRFLIHHTRSPTDYGDTVTSFLSSPFRDQAHPARARCKGAPP